MEDDLSSILADLGLISSEEAVDVTPLAGGVSSDIVLVTTGSGRRFCVKRALPRLKSGHALGGAGGPQRRRGQVDQDGGTFGSQKPCRH